MRVLDQRLIPNLQRLASIWLSNSPNSTGDGLGNDRSNATLRHAAFCSRQQPMHQPLFQMRVMIMTLLINDIDYLTDQLKILNDELTDAVVKITEEIIQKKDVKTALSVIGSLPESHPLRPLLVAWAKAQSE